MSTVPPSDVTGPDVPGPEWCSVRLEHDPPSGGVPVLVVRDRIRLADTDSSGRIYYGAVAPWLTRAQQELWIALGFHPVGLVPNPMLPVVHAEFDYRGPLVLGDAYELRCWVEKAGTTSVTMGFSVDLHRGSGSAAGHAGDGTMVTARTTHVHLGDDGRPSPLPAALVAAARGGRGGGRG